MEVTEIDLRKYFDNKKTGLKETLSEFDLIWVRGGNVFILRRAFAQSRADKVIPELLKNNEVVYGGYSAGVDILQPHLHGIELVDDPYMIPQGYKPEIIWECLGLIPFCVAPHYKSVHPESAAIDKTVEYYIENHIPFIALRDGEAMVINGEVRTVVG